MTYTYCSYFRIIILLLLLFFLPRSNNAQGEPDKLPLDSLTAKAESFIGESVDSVLKYASKAITAAQKSGNIGAIADNYLSIHKAYYQNNEIDSAMLYAKKALSLKDQLNIKEKEASIYHALGIIFYKTGELDSALLFYQKEYDLEEQLGRLQKEASALGNIGMVYYRQSKYQQAIDTYFQCLKIFQNANEDKKVMLTYNNIGNVYRYWEDYPKALLYYKKAMKIAKREGSKRFSGFMNNNLAIIYRKQQKFDSAIVYYHRAKDIYKEVNYQKGVASALTGLAITYNKQEELDKSYRTYLEAVKIQEKVHDKVGLASNYGNLGILSLDYSKPQEALIYLKKSDSIAKKIGYKEVQINNYETFRDAYSMLGDFKKALDFELQYVNLKDSIYNIEKLRDIEDIQEKYQAEQKQHKIDILNEQARIKDIKLSRKNIAIISLAIIILLALVIGWLINHNNKVKAKRNLIVLENKLLRSQMNPHFLFNSLNAIQTYILRKNPLEGASYLSKFAELMRSILYNSREEFITLEKEILMIKNYLELQQIRFNNIFSYSIEVDPKIDIKRTLIPPMLAQPFIENAVEHGFKNIYYQGKLKVSFIMSTDYISIKIMDNGVGVEKSKEDNQGKEKLHKSLATVISKERLGLFNKRMKKDIFSLSIEQLNDDEGKVSGTLVAIKIPFKI